MNQVQRLSVENKLSGGISLLELVPGTKLRVATKNSIYEMVVRCGILIDIRGGRRSNGEDRYPCLTPVVLHCVTCNGLTKQYGWIGFGSQMEIIEVTTGMVILTSQVLDLKITAEDDSWSYELERPISDADWKAEGF